MRFRNVSRHRVPTGRSQAEIIAVGPGFKTRLHWLAYLLVLAVVRHVLRNRGFRKVARCLARLFGKEGYVIFRIFGQRQIKIFLKDVYWMSPLLKVGDYEPDVRYLLARLMKEDAVFLDCGANVGWWSLFASTRIALNERILAVEASPSIFEHLRQNAELNFNAFVPLNAAVWGSTGKRLTLVSRPERHAEASVKTDAPAMRCKPGYVAETAISVAIDDLVDRHFPGFSGPFIVKLDVEGAEREALQGAKRLLETNPLIIYEDHGEDLHCAATGALMEAGFCIFHCDPALAIRRLPDLRSVQAVKRSRKIGYNFAACRPDSRFFAELAGDLPDRRSMTASASRSWEDVRAERCPMSVRS